MAETPHRTSESIRALITVMGVVQGVGFRPFVFRLAERHGLAGEIFNDTSGVRIHVEGEPARVNGFISDLHSEHPPRAVITGLTAETMEPLGYESFTIGPSVGGGASRLLVSPDSCTCDDCLEELFDGENRRYRYPFINCTNCGPRFTIIEELPYDRPATTMKRFIMCPDCRGEYEDPADRRFHAEPNACSVCGPNLWLSDRTGSIQPVDDPITSAAEALRAGRIIALKGLGGFQLACLADNEEAVARLRERKHRPHKPFAVMVATADDAALYCHVSHEERQQLESVQRPIVLLESLGEGGIADGVAPGIIQLGLMLPHAPIHFLLLAELRAPLVMTSGNLSEEPICRTNTEALSRLGEVADQFLLHNRKIKSTYDDSVVMVELEKTMIVRRARGYAPLPVKLPRTAEPILAAGAELKSTFCLTKDDDAFISQHLGDLENVDTLLHYERTEMLYERLFSTQPSLFVCDGHPGYLSSTYCHERHPAPLIVQHHKAHVASCLADNGFTGRVVGIAFDGTGLGEDGLIWGGEFFTGSLADGFERGAHIDYFPLLGGEAAIREPWRTALAAVWQFAPEAIGFCADRLGINEKKSQLLMRQLETRINCPGTSSCGRLLDAVAALTLKRFSVSYEAQAAMELEAAALMSGHAALKQRMKPELDDLAYRISLDTGVTPWKLSPDRCLRRVIRDIENGKDPKAIAALFHLGLAEAIVRTCVKLADHHGLETAAISGGVFQNRLLLRLVSRGLRDQGIRLLTQGKVPTNDGGISLGQAALAAYYQDN